MHRLLVLSLTLCACASHTASLLREEGLAAMKAGRGAEAFADFEAARSLDVDAPAPPEHAAARAQVLRSELDALIRLRQDGKLEEAWKQALGRRAYEGWTAADRAQLDLELARTYDAYVGARLAKVAGRSPMAKLPTLAALSRLELPPEVPATQRQRLEDELDASLAWLTQYLAQAETKGQLAGAYSVAAMGAPLLDGLDPTIGPRRDALQKKASQVHAARASTLGTRFPVAADLHARVAHDIDPEVPAPPAAPPPEPVSPKIALAGNACPGLQGYANEHAQGMVAIELAVERCTSELTYNEFERDREIEVPRMGLRETTSSSYEAGSNGHVGGWVDHKVTEEVVVGYDKQTVHEFVTAASHAVAVDAVATIRIGGWSASYPLSLVGTGMGENAGPSPYPPRPSLKTSGFDAVAKELDQRFQELLPQAKAAALVAEGTQAAAAGRNDEAEEAFARVLVLYPSVAPREAQAWFDERYGLGLDLVAPLYAPRDPTINPLLPMRARMEHDLAPVDLLGPERPPLELPPTTDVNGLLDPRRKHFALRGGYGTHLGIRGVGLEIRPTGRNIGLAVGSGTYLLSGGLSFNSGDMDETSVYLDLHATWIRQGLFTGPVGSGGIGWGGTVGVDLRPVRWLSLKLGGGLAHNPAARDTGKWRVLVYDLSAGLVF